VETKTFKTMENLEIRITGGGTRKEISDALNLIAKSILDTPVEDLDGAEWEDCTLMTEINTTVKARITDTEVIEVAKEMGIPLDIKDINWLISCFEDSQRQDPQTEWKPIVEDLLIHMLSNR